MVRRFYDLPSLNALAAFEAVARHLSLSRAAAELNVTPGAVSKQLRHLEEDLGRKLFTRHFKGIALTHEGEVVAASLQDSFERVAATLRQVRQGGEGRNVSIGTTMAIMQLWLMPRLGAFWNLHQDIVVDHVISDRLHEIPSANIDLRLRYGDGNWAGEQAVKLYDDHILAVASPEFLRQTPIATLSVLSSAPLLGVEGADWIYTTWASFLREAGAPVRRLAIRRFNSYVISLQAARDGQGVALGWASLVRPLIAAQELVQVTGAEIADPHSIYVSWSDRHPLSPQAEVLKDWLLAQDS